MHLPSASPLTHSEWERETNRMREEKKGEKAVRGTGSKMRKQGRAGEGERDEDKARTNLDCNKKKFMS